jgi:AcrR family transcriptional regulator
MTTTGASTYHHGDLPAALLAAVGEIVSEKGTAGVTLREAARRAGVSHSAPAHHFGDKDGLLAAYCEQGFDIMAEQVGEAFAAAAAEGAPTTSEMISILGRAYVQFAADHPNHFNAMFRSGLDSVDDAAHDELEEHGAMALLRTMVDDLAASGTIERRQAEAVTVVLWAVAHGLASLWVDGAIETMFPGVTLEGLLEAAFGEDQVAFRVATSPVLGEV